MRGCSTGVISFSSSGSAVFGNSEVSGVAPTNFATPDLKWEETSQLNIGLDFGLWGDRVYGSVEYYIKNTTDLLLEFNVPQPAAVPTQLANAGEMENTGIEFALNARVLDRRDLCVEVGATFNANTNEIKDLSDLDSCVPVGGGDTGTPCRRIFTGSVSGAGLSSINAQIITQGQPFGSFWGATFLGFDPVTGVQTFELDADGNRTLGIIGDAQPDFTYGFTTNVTYKDVDFSFFLRGEQGRDLLNNTALEYTSKFLANTNVNFLEEALNDPTPLDDSAPVYSSRWVQDGSFLRMENITLGYTFSNVTALSGAVGVIRRARIYVAANNLFVLTSYDGFDPEANTSAASSTGNIPILSLGIDYTNYPRPRSFTAGIQLGF